jgi:hypothetical protein
MLEKVIERAMPHPSLILCQIFPKSQERDVTTKVYNKEVTEGGPSCP